MKTLVTDVPDEAAEIIRRGGIVAFPTETVFGLGADVFNPAAIEKIFEAKRRPDDNPLIVHIASKDQIEKVGSSLTSFAQKLIDAFFPGPLTIVVSKTKSVPLVATAGLQTVGIRMPRNEIAQAFLNSCGRPVAAPSANLSGRPSPTTWQAVFEDLNGRIDCILKGEATEIGLESTVVDCSGESAVLLRPGAIGIEQLHEVIPEIRISDGKQTEARSPGTRHQHYAPRAKVKLITGSESLNATERSAYIGIGDRHEHFLMKKICETTGEYAHDLFEFFRECDRKNISTIYCEKVPDIGIGAAMMDRLRRASEN